MMSSLNGQLHAVGQGLQQAERADLVRAGPHRHPGHDPALVPDAEQRHAQPKTKTHDDLDEDEPPRVLAEVGQRRVLGQDRHARQVHAAVLRCVGGHRRPATVTTAPEVAPRLRRTVEPGRVRRQPDHAVGHLGDRGRQRDRAAVGADGDRGRRRRRRARRRRPCRAAPPAAGPCRPGTSSPSSRLPRSISWCQVASTASPAPGCGRRGRLDRAARPAGPPGSPAARRARGGSRRRRRCRASTPSSRGERVEHPGVGHRRWSSSTASKVRSRPSQFRKRAGLLDHRRDREAPRRPAGSPRCCRSSRLTRKPHRRPAPARPAAGRPGRPGRRRPPPARRACRRRRPR